MNLEDDPVQAARERALELRDELLAMGWPNAADLASRAVQPVEITEAWLKKLRGEMSCSQYGRPMKLSLDIRSFSSTARSFVGTSPSCSTLCTLSPVWRQTKISVAGVEPSGCMEQRLI
jgi:hypothetical protein